MLGIKPRVSYLLPSYCSPHPICKHVKTCLKHVLRFLKVVEIASFGKLVLWISKNASGITVPLFWKASLVPGNQRPSALPRHQDFHSSLCNARSPVLYQFILTERATLGLLWFTHEEIEVLRAQVTYPFLTFSQWYNQNSDLRTWGLKPCC